MGEEVDILGKGTKCKLLSVINKVLLHLAPTYLFTLASFHTAAWMMHSGYPNYLQFLEYILQDSDQVLPSL